MISKTTMFERLSSSGGPQKKRQSGRALIACLLLGACSSGASTDGPGSSGGSFGSDGGSDSMFASGGDANLGTGGAPNAGTGGVANGGDGNLGAGGEGPVSSGGGGAGAGGAETAGVGGDGVSSGGSLGTGTLILEEEGPGQCSVDGIVESANGGFTGSGYLNANNNTAARIVWSVAVGEAGVYTLTFVYANAGADRPAQVIVDAATVNASLSFPSTADWTTWSEATIQLPLEAGTHTIALDPLQAEGLVNVDRLEIEGANASPGQCEIDEGPDGTQPVTIWLAGDSTVANGSTPCPSGWGKFFKDQFNDNVTVNNWAVGGRSVRTWLYDVTTTMGGDGECVINTDGQGNRVIQSRWTDMLAQMSAGDYLFIQFGINDGDSSCNRHVGGDAFKEEYAMMAQAAFERGVVPVFLTPVSMIRCSGSTAIGSRGFLTETFDVGAAEGVTVIDLHQLSVDLYASLNFCPIPGGDVSAGTTGPVGDFFCDDHTHFSDIGGAQVAALVAEAVASSGLGLAAYLK